MSTIYCSNNPSYPWIKTDHYEFTTFWHHESFVYYSKLHHFRITSETSYEDDDGIKTIHSMVDMGEAELFQYSLVYEHLGDILRGQRMYQKWKEIKDVLSISNVTQSVISLT